MIHESIAVAVLERFGFAASAVEAVRPLMLGTKDSSLRVRADGRDWVLKSHSASETIAPLRLAHAVEARLAAEGFPVAPIQHAPAGSTLVQFGQAHYSLHGWVDGQHATITERERVLDRRPFFLREFAGHLARIHQVAGDLEGLENEFPVLPVERRLQGPHRATRAVRRMRPPLLSPWLGLRLARNKTDFERWIVRAFPTLVQEAEDLSRLAATSPLNQAEIIVIHHDINWENIVFDADFRILALLDFDNATRAPRELEVGAAAVALAGTDPSRVEDFVSAYEEAAGLSVDRGAVSHAMRLKCAQSIAHTVRTHLTVRSRSTDRPDGADLREAWCRSLFASLQDLTGGDTAS